MARNPSPTGARGNQGLGGEVSFQVAATQMRELAADSKRILKGALEDLADRMLPDVQAPWPVDTGLSRSTWMVEETRKGADLVNPTDYTAFVHDGLAERLVPQVLAKHEPWFVDTLNDRIERIDAPHRFGRRRS